MLPSASCPLRCVTDTSILNVAKDMWSAVLPVVMFPVIAVKIASNSDHPQSRQLPRLVSLESNQFLIERD